MKWVSGRTYYNLNYFNVDNMKYIYSLFKKYIYRFQVNALTPVSKIMCRVLRDLLVKF